MKAIELEQLAVMFRTNDPNLGHVSVLEQMNEAGLAYMYGVFRGTPKRYRKERQRLANAIANRLSEMARKESA